MKESSEDVLTERVAKPYLLFIKFLARNYPLAPDAYSSSYLVEKMAATNSKGHHMPGNVPTTTRQPRYIYNTAEESLLLLEDK